MYVASMMMMMMMDEIIKKKKIIINKIALALVEEDIFSFTPRDNPSDTHLKTGYYIVVKFRGKEEDEDGATKEEEEERTYCPIK